MLQARPVRALSVLRLIALAATVGAVAFTAACSKDAELPDFGEAPDFVLTSQDGGPISSADLRGKVWVASFVYTSCTDVCLLLTPRMRSLQRLLAAQGLLNNGRVALVSFSVDPEQDTPEALRKYAARYEADLATWTFLTGEPATMRDVVTNGLHLAYERIDGEPVYTHDDGTLHRHALGDYEVTHSTRIVLVDLKGHIRAFYLGLEVPIEQMARDVAHLLRG